MQGTPRQKWVVPNTKKTNSASPGVSVRIFDIYILLSIQVFQVVSLDGWQQVMWHTQDAAGEETWVFFVVVLILGNAVLVSVSYYRATSR